jgi:penicillin V acylase-like amidase (Ntn superfamily)
MCTTITIANEDGSFTHGRTMEWGEFDFRSRVSLTPPGVASTGTTPDGAPGRSWTSKIPAMGLDMLGSRS